MVTTPMEFWPHHTTLSLGLTPASSSTRASRLAAALSSGNVSETTGAPARSSTTATLSGKVAAWAVRRSGTGSVTLRDASDVFRSVAGFASASLDDAIAEAPTGNQRE